LPQAQEVLGPDRAAALRRASGKWAPLADRPNAEANKAGAPAAAWGLGMRLHRHRGVRRKAAAGHANRLAPSTKRTCTCPEPARDKTCLLACQAVAAGDCSADVPFCRPVWRYYKVAVGGARAEQRSAVPRPGPADIGANAEATSAGLCEPILKNHFDCGFPQAALLISTD